jgi:hypothetical protein
MTKNDLTDDKLPPAIKETIAYLYYFLDTAIKYKADALIIKNQNDNDNKATPTFETLASLCLEMFPKVLIGCRICLKYKNNKKISSEQIILEVAKEMNKTNHDLQELYDNDLNLCTKLKITIVSTLKNKFTLRYLIELADSSKIYITDFISIRYGAFAKNKNYSYGDKKNEEVIKNFLDNLEIHVKEEFTKTAQKLKNR